MRLKEIRKARKLTQQQVADLLGIPLRTYQNYEREINDPDTDILCRLADYYAVTTDYLIGYSDIAVQGVGDVVSADESKLLGLYRQLNNTGKSIAMDLIDTMVISGKYE